jgi:hypothetical protein
MLVEALHKERAVKNWPLLLGDYGQHSTDSDLIGDPGSVHCLLVLSHTSIAQNGADSRGGTAGR